MNTKHLILAIVLGFSFVVGLTLAASKLSKMRQEPQEIVVKGVAERNFKSDLIVWKASFSAKSSNLSDAYRELQKTQRHVEKYIRTKGMVDSTYTFSSVSIEKEYSSYYENGNYRQIFVGYSLSQELKVTSHNIDGVESLSRGITELINLGIEITSKAPAYYYTKLNELKQEMLRESSQDALARATVIAEGSERNVGKLQSSYMGVFQIVGQYSDEDYSWGGSFNTSSKYKTATITVKNTYSIR